MKRWLELLLLWALAKVFENEYSWVCTLLQCTPARLIFCSRFRAALSSENTNEYWQREAFILVGGAWCPSESLHDRDLCIWTCLFRSRLYKGAILSSVQFNLDSNFHRASYFCLYSTAQISALLTAEGDAPFCLNKFKHCTEVVFQKHLMSDSKLIWQQLT